MKSSGRAQLAKALELFERLEAAPDLPALDGAARPAFELFGVTAFVAARMKLRARMTFMSGVQDPRWSSLYLERRFDRLDPVLPILRGRTQPVFWDELDRRTWSKDVHALFGEAAGFGYNHGMSIPWEEPGEAVGGVALVGPDPDLRSPALKLLALTYADRARAIIGPQEGEAHRPLTQRQLDCLAWAAEGKTDWEIGQILGIAEGTVARHFERIRERLGLPTRTQAIVYALRRGWLPLAYANPHKAEERPQD